MGEVSKTDPIGKGSIQTAEDRFASREVFTNEPFRLQLLGLRRTDGGRPRTAY